VRVDPYLFFQGRCEEALDFYRTTVGAQIDAVIRFRDMPQAGVTNAPDKVMHAAFRIGETTLLASDGDNTGSPSFGGFSLSLSAESDAEAARLFAALAEGGQVRMPLGPTPFASSFGMLADRFGVPWIIVRQTV